MTGVARRNLDQIKNHPDAYLQHARSLQTPDFWPQLLELILIIGILVFVVEGLAHLIGLGLPRKDGLDRKSIGATFE